MIALAIGLFVAIAGSSNPCAAAEPKKESAKHKNYTEQIPGSIVKFGMIAIRDGNLL